MKNLRMIAITSAFAMTMSLSAFAQNTTKATNGDEKGSPTVTAADVEGGGATIPKKGDTKNVRKARKTGPATANTNVQGAQGSAHEIDNARQNSNAEVAGTPSGTAEENVNSAEAHKNSDVQK